MVIAATSLPQSMFSARATFVLCRHSTGRSDIALLAALRAIALALIFTTLSCDLYAYPVRYDFSGWVEGVEVTPEEGERPFEGSLTGAVIFEGGPAVVRVPSADEFKFPHFRVRLSQTIILDGRIWTSADVTGQFCDVYLSMQHQEVQFECGLDLGGGWTLQSMLWLHDPHLLPDDTAIPEGPFVGGEDSGGRIILLDIVNDLTGERIFSRGGARLEQISSVDAPASAWLLLPLLAVGLLHRPAKRRSSQR